MSVRVRYKLIDGVLTSKTFVVGSLVFRVEITTNPITVKLVNVEFGTTSLEPAETLAEAKKIGKTLLTNAGVQFADEVRIRTMSTLNNSVNTTSDLHDAETRVNELVKDILVESGLATRIVTT